MKLKTLVVLVLAVAAIAGAGLYAAKKLKPPATAVASDKPAAKPTLAELAKTDVLTASTVELLQGLQISGAVKSPNSATVKVRVAGELQGLTVREGDSVRAGQIIARVESSEYASRVKQAEDTAAASKAQIDIAQRSADNNKALVDQGFISKTALDVSLASLAGARASHQAALSAIDLAKKSQEDTLLRAPISGQVASRSVQNGERVGVDARVIDIVDLSRLELEAAIATADSTGLRIGQTARVQIEGMPGAVEAKIVRISPVAQAGSRSVLAYLSLPPLPGLRQGLFAQASLGTQSLRGVALPVGAVRTDKPEPYVQVVAGGKVVHQPVQIQGAGEFNGIAMLALQGLAEGTQVLAAHVGSVPAGITVTFTAEPAKPAVSIEPAKPGASK